MYLSVWFLTRKEQKEIVYNIFIFPTAVRQFADICLFSTAQYKCTVAEMESEWVPALFA